MVASAGPLGLLSFDDFLATMAAREDEADEYYDVIAPPGVPADERRIQRQAFAGLLWGKQYYHFGERRARRVCSRRATSRARRRCPTEHRLQASTCG